MAATGSSSSSKLKGKQTIISISSSSSSDQEESEEEVSEDPEEEVDDEWEEEGSEEEEDDEEGQPSSEDDSGSTADYDDEGDEDAEEEEEGEDDVTPEGKPTDEERCKKVVDLLQRRRSLNTLKLEECKAYLRIHQLRLSGTKATCIERILEHWRIKDGNGEKFYPRGSFFINCTGDVCKGDVILFKQRVYEKFELVTRGGNIIGKRTIAGRVVKESYGAAKQQHTFTIEILWSKGVKALPTLFPLLVKGRNLYRLKTFRQRWSNEAERSKVLAEKHKRGAAARHVRAIAKARSANKGTKRHGNSTAARAPPNKRRKKELDHATRKTKQNLHHAKPLSDGHAKMKHAKMKQVTKTDGHAKMKQVTKTDGHAKMKHAKMEQVTKTGGHAKMKQVTKTDGHAMMKHANMKQVTKNNCHANMKQVTRTRRIESSANHAKHHSYHENAIHTQPPFPQRIPPYDYHSTQMELHRRNEIAASQLNREMFHLPDYNAGYSSAAAGALHHHMFNRGNYMSQPYGNPTPRFDPRISSHIFGQVHFGTGRMVPSGEQFHRWRQH